MRKPTLINVGAVIAGILARTALMGENNKVNANRRQTITAVSPVLPPTATPELDSIYAEVGLVPNKAPVVVPTASAKRAPLERGNLFALSRPACSATPSIVPVVSNKVINTNVKITAYRPLVNTPLISS